jgi:hypothetical protein
MRPVWPAHFNNRKIYIRQVAAKAGLKVKFDFQSGFVLLDDEIEVVVKRRTISLQKDLDDFLKQIHAYVSAKLKGGGRMDA